MRIMLKDVKIQNRLGILAAVMGISPKRVDTGIYIGCGFNFSNCVDPNLWNGYWYDKTFDVPSYGVADSVEQFLTKYGQLLRDSPVAFAVGFTEVKRADEPREGGWRWHKWGEYVGEERPACEYLHDEPEIESVVTFSVLREK